MYWRGWGYLFWELADFWWLGIFTIAKRMPMVFYLGAYLFFYFFPYLYDCIKSQYRHVQQKKYRSRKNLSTLGHGSGGSDGGARGRGAGTLRSRGEKPSDKIRKQYFSCERKNKSGFSFSETIFKSSNIPTYRRRGAYLAPWRVGVYSGDSLCGVTQRLTWFLSRISCREYPG